MLASQEVTLPDAAKEPIQNLHAEVEIVTPWLRDYEYDMSWLLLQKIGEDEVDNPDLGRKSIALPMNLKRSLTHSQQHHSTKESKQAQQGHL